jgi:hypothetical protein
MHASIVHGCALWVGCCAPDPSLAPCFLPWCTGCCDTFWVLSGAWSHMYSCVQLQCGLSAGCCSWHAGLLAILPSDCSLHCVWARRGRLVAAFLAHCSCAGPACCGLQGQFLACVYCQGPGCWDGCSGLFCWLALRSQYTTTCAVVQPCAGGCQRWAGVRALLCCSRVLRAAAGDLYHAIARCRMLYAHHPHMSDAYMFGVAPLGNGVARSYSHTPQVVSLILGWWCSFLTTVSSSCPAARVFRDVC